MIELVHQFEQLAQLAPRKAFTGEPAEVVAGEVGDFLALVFTEGYFADEEELEVFGFHRGGTLANPATGVACREEEGINMDTEYELQRFVDAQRDVYDTALAELRAGRKRTHWMWFIFPQMEGLGGSEMARRYAIRSADEAAAYLAHPVLGPRLRSLHGRASPCTTNAPSATSSAIRTT